MDIRKHEVCSIVFPTDLTTTFIDVLALREDFPQVPHLNLREQEYPKSLCVYEDPFSEYGLKWSPVRFIEDIRRWLARTARNELHQAGQQLEPLLEPGAPELVVPNGLLQGLKSGDYLFLDYYCASGATNRLIIRGRPDTGVAAGMFAVFVVGKLQPHGIMRRKPVTLADLGEFLKAGDIDVVSVCQKALKDYISSGNRAGQDTRMAILVDLPKARYEGGPEERREHLAFITHATIGQLSSALGISEVIDGHVGMLIGQAAKPDAKQLPIVPFRRLEPYRPKQPLSLTERHPIPAPCSSSGWELWALMCLSIFFERVSDDGN